MQYFFFQEALEKNWVLYRETDESSFVQFVLYVNQKFWLLVFLFFICYPAKNLTSKPESLSIFFDINPDLRNLVPDEREELVNSCVKHCGFPPYSLSLSTLFSDSVAETQTVS